MLGVDVKVEVRKQHGTTGLRVKCPYHERCPKYRACSIGVGAFGPQAPALYLETWLVAGQRLTGKEHRSMMPAGA